MNLVTVLFGYISWHYSKAIFDILGVWVNFLWWTQHFFSLPTLAKTLFSPWKRLHEEYKRGIIDEDFFANLVVNTLMRIVGALFRLVIIIIGLIFLLLVFTLGLIFLIFWFVAPVAIVIFFIYGLTLLGFS